MSNFCIKPGYLPRERPLYFDDFISEPSDSIVHQQSIYDIAFYIADRVQCNTVIDIGCGSAKKLRRFAGKRQIIGVDFGSNLEFCRKNYDFGIWIDHDLESDAEIDLPEGALDNALVICSDVIEHLINPAALLKNIRLLMNRAAYGLISTPERDLVRGEDDMGPPQNPAHVREWNIAEFGQLLNEAGLSLGFIGLAENNTGAREKKTICAIAQNPRLAPVVEATPNDFEVMAIMTAYNEADILPSTIPYLLEQGIKVHILDNWSTDGTPAILNSFGAETGFSSEKFPPDGPSQFYHWGRLLDRVDEIARNSTADWCIHQDADEIRTSPWPGVGLRDAIYAVDRLGFGAIDHTVLDFPPTPETRDPIVDLDKDFTHFRFGQNRGHFRQIKAWKNTGETVHLSRTGGHSIDLGKRNIFPFKFVLKHYPVRSNQHGKRKIFVDRRSRWDPEERARGWHKHYDCITTETNFIEDSQLLIEFSIERLMAEYLVEMISGAGLPGNSAI